MSSTRNNFFVVPAKPPTIHESTPTSHFSIFKSGSNSMSDGPEAVLRIMLLSNDKNDDCKLNRYFFGDAIRTEGDKANFGSKVMKVNGKKVELKSWAGEGTKSDSARRLLNEPPSAIILLVDLAKKSNLESVEYLIQYVKKNCWFTTFSQKDGKKWWENISIVIAGTNADLPREITRESAEIYIEDYNRRNPDQAVIVGYVETSVKRNENVDELFQLTMKTIMNKLYQPLHFSEEHELQPVINIKPSPADSKCLIL